MRLLVVWVFVLLSSAAALGQERPVVRVDVTPETVIVGESAQMTVTVLVPTWFTRPPVYPAFELANAMTRLPPDSSYPIRERVGNDSWPGIVRSYEIYPLLGATYRLGGQSLQVTYANPGSDPVVTSVEIPEIVIRGQVPQGAELLDPYIAGSNLELRLDIEGSHESLKAGDALVLEYVAELKGLPAIFIPPLAPDLQLDGVSVYADAPDVKEGTPARRSEKITLVLDAGGEFVIPERELKYWNTESKSIETVVAEGLTFSVAGPPVPTAMGDVSSARQTGRLVWLLAGSIALLFVLWRSVPAIIARYRIAAAERKQTEAYAFARLSEALNSNDGEVAYRAMLQWIGRLEPGMNARAFASAYGDESLSAAVDAISAGLYGNAERAGDLRRVRGNLKAARKRYLQRGLQQAAQSLPPLNPN
jgi:hypothetical protein